MLPKLLAVLSIFLCLSIFPSMLEDDLQLSDSEDSDTEQVSVELRDQELF